MPDTPETDIWLDEPVITALSDAPVAEKTFDLDAFDLARTMGPVYDILRHAQTQTPLSIGVYGDWGSGKSTAMHWLEDRLTLWTEDAKTNKRKGRVKVYTTWFYPWKYDKKEEVWRGLIAEIMLACLTRIEGTGSGTWTKMAKDLGGFLGKSFVHALSSVKLKGAGAEVSFKDLMNVVDDAADYFDPTRAYLNEFESVLTQTLKDTLGNYDRNGKRKDPPERRLVVFIDDLDRCLPEVALQVLEALKLYLNIPDLVFVLGVDDEVVTQLVVKHYDKHGLPEHKSKSYLGKMFQVEVPVQPLEQKLKDFLAGQIRDNVSWKGLGLDAQDTEVFSDVILRMSGGTPREIKRLMNYCLMAGRGEQMASDATITPAQAMQIRLLQKRLETHGKRTMLNTVAGQTVFFELSQAMASQDGATAKDVADTLDVEMDGAVIAITDPSHRKTLDSLTDNKGDDILKDPVIKRLLER
ncbi:MAG: hypothetical protein HQL35_10690, partial [Alphaproteobacteria bacterium]|nr:hypothetical protein [Alphaproteobacteria bacterium]